MQSNFGNDSGEQLSRHGSETTGKNESDPWAQVPAFLQSTHHCSIPVASWGEDSVPSDLCYEQLSRHGSETNGTNERSDPWAQVPAFLQSTQHCSIPVASWDEDSVPSATTGTNESDPWAQVPAFLQLTQHRSIPVASWGEDSVPFDLCYSQGSMQILNDPWTEVPQSLPQPPQQQEPQAVLSGSDACSEDADAVTEVGVPSAQLQFLQFDFWGEDSNSQHRSVQYDIWGEDNPDDVIVASAPDGLCAPAPCRGAPIKYVNGSHATRRISDQRIREQKKLLGDAFVPKPRGRPPEQFDNPHIKKRQNWADKQEGLAISSEILNPQWQARVLAYADTRQGKKQMGHLADALNKSKTANTMINNCNEILKGRPQAAVTFAPEELKRLYPEDVVGKFTVEQCVENLGRLGVRAPENTLDSMRTTLARIGGTGSIAGEAGVRAGAKHRAELTGKLTQGITARDAAKLLPNVTSKYITAAKARENDTAFVSSLGENYASNTTRDKISPAQANLYVNYFDNLTNFKSGSSAHTKSRILTKQRHEVVIDLFANFPKLLRQWAVENATEMERINGTLTALRSKFEADVLAAASHKEYDLSSTEHDIREMMAKQEYQSRLRKNAQAQRKFGKVRPSSKGSSQGTQTRLEELLKKPDAPPYLQESAPGQNPCSEEVFWRILTDNKIKFTTTVRPTNCPIHEMGPSNVRAFREALLEEQLLEAEFNRTTGLLDDRKRLLDARRPEEEGRQNDADEADLRACTEAVNQAKSELLKVGQKKLKLQKHVELYHKHVAQYETSRAEVNKIMENLGPDECLVYRDFVNQHSWYDNTKVCNLILVLIWKEDGQLYSMKLNNFCSDEDSCSTDPYYVRDVFDFHMKPKSVQLGHTGLLSRFKKIYISGRVLTKPHLHLTLS